MKVVFFHDSKLKYDKKGVFYTNGGLTREYLQRYLEIFEEMTVVTRKEEIDEEKIDKYSVTSSEKIKFNCVYRLNIFSLLFGKDNKIIKSEIKNNQFAIIRLPSFIGIISCHYANKYKKKYIIEMVGCPFNSYWHHGSILGKIIAPFMYIVNRYYIKKAENVMYVSNEFLQERYPNNNNNIGCSDVNIGDMSDEVLKKRLEKISKKKKNEAIKIGLIGSLDVNYKGHDVAIKAISKLKAKYNIELHFLGAGNKNNWERLIEKYNVENNVIFDGTLPSGQEVYNWMDEMDIYIIPSLTEGMPRALIEAMSRGCPCVGTSVGGIKELLPTEFLINAGRYKELENKIMMLLNDKNLQKKCAIQNFNLAQEFCYDKLKEKRDKFYYKILKEVQK